MSKKILSISVIVLLFVSLTYAFIQSKKEYIQGNILNIPIVSSYEDRIPSPFSTSGFITGLLYTPLILAEPSLDKFKPHLAKSYEILNNGYTYKFVLRDTKWSDGTPVTPQDIIFTIETLFVKNPLAKSGILTTTLSKIAKFDVDENILYMHLDTPHYNLLTALAQLPIMPKHILENEDLENLHLSTYWSNPIVSGMYKVKELEHKTHFILERNDFYFGDKPKIENIKLYFQTQASIFDYFSTNDIAEMTTFRALKGYSQYQIEMNFVRYLVFAMQGENGFYNPNMQDRRVREAICLAINNVGLVDTIYFQVAEETDSATRNDGGYFNYNPEKAKELLAEANYDFSKPLTIMYYYHNSTADDVMNYLKKNLEDVGFTVQLVKPVGNQTMYTEVNYDILYKGLAGINATEWYQEYHSAHPFLTNIIDLQGEFDDLINQLTESSQENYHNILAKIQEAAYNKLYKFPIYSPLQIAYVNTARVQLPKNIVFANPWYIADLDFENWEIKKQ